MKTAQWEPETRSSWEIHFDTRSETHAYWHNKSCNLCDAAKILWNSWDNGKDGLYDSGDTYRMLMGMSFELLFKTFYIAKGEKFKPIHDIDILAKKAGFELNDKEEKIFSILSGYIYWEGRYPVPKSTEKITGSERIKQQWVVSKSDFDYDNLFKLWQKFNDKYVSEYI